jgi:hypothetical protein
MREEMIEALAKISEVFTKYAWGVFVVCLIVILLPDGLGVSMGLKTIKGDYLGFWWIALFFSGAILGKSVFLRVSEWFLRKWKDRKAMSNVIRSLYTLDHQERTWLKCCLYQNTHTLYATHMHQTANSLQNKGIVKRGSGSILRLPFHMTDFVWEYLQDHREEFLPPVTHTAHGEQELRRFIENLLE